MSNEPGERRRRREAERARQLAAEEATGEASGASVPAEGAPAGGAAAGGAAADGGSSRPTPAATGPVPVAGAQGRPLSRRELRELERRRAAESGEELPVDLPPGADRSGHGPHGRRSAAEVPGALDGGEPEQAVTGLLPVQRTGPPGATTSSGATADAPRAGRSDEPPSGPGEASTTSRPSLPSVPVLPGRSSPSRTGPRPHAGPAAPRTDAPAGARPVAPVDRTTGEAAPAGRTAAGGAPPGSATPFAASSPSASSPSVSSPTASGPTVSSPAASDHAAAGPTPGTTPPGDVAGPARNQDDQDEHDDPHEDEPPHERHRYTALHLLVLLLVAFVLGFLVWSLITSGTDDGADGALPAPPTPSSVMPAAHRGEL